MRIASHRLVSGVAWTWALVGLAGHAVARAAEPPPPAPADACGDTARCELASGANCPEAPAPLEVVGFPADKLAALERAAGECKGAWDGKSGCYEKRIRQEVDQLIDTSVAVTGYSEREQHLPPEARHQCSKLEPVRIQDAIDEAPAWCVIAKEDCVTALGEARRVLEALPAWASCIERMEVFARSNAKLEAAEALCLELDEDTEQEASGPGAPEDEGAPELESAPEPRPQPEPYLEVVYAPPGKVSKRAPVPREEAPRQRTADEPSPVVAAITPPGDAPASPDAGVARSGPPPKDIDAGYRQGQVELAVSPFAGVLTIRDPGTQAEHRPLMASVGLAVEVVVPLSLDFALELGLGGRGSFASTALEQAITVSLEDLDISTGTAFIAEIEPSLTLLSRYLGVGLVADVRWDTITITHGGRKTTTKQSGTGGGMRLIAGIGLLERDMRFLATLDWLFIGPGEGAAVRASLTAEIKAFVLTGSYRQHFRMGLATEAYVVDDMQLTLGYRAVF